ncbi:MAG TPA: hypothetical protein VK524_33945 [Polyangiaceae bacterium]|nr:hypothetical protein [Polyangiaceae bacterium]
MSLFEPLFSPSDRRHSESGEPNGKARADERALARYRHMLQTAPPETIEQAHADAFARLTPNQRRRALAALAKATPASEQSMIQANSGEDPRQLARLATRTELRRPGVVERTLVRSGIGLGGGMLASFVAGFAGSLVAQSFFSALGNFAADEVGPLGEDAALAQEGATEASDEVGFGDEGTYDFGSHDFGIDI